MANARGNVRSIRSNFRALRLSDAMQEAIAALGGRARPMDVAIWIHQHYAHREWKVATIYSYFYQMSRSPVFFRIRRGQYRTTRNAVIRRAA